MPRTQVRYHSSCPVLSSALLVPLDRKQSQPLINTRTTQVPQTLSLSSGQTDILAALSTMHWYQGSSWGDQAAVHAAWHTHGTWSECLWTCPCPSTGSTHCRPCGCGPGMLGTQPGPWGTGSHPRGCKSEEVPTDGSRLGGLPSRSGGRRSWKGRVESCGNGRPKATYRASCMYTL